MARKPILIVDDEPIVRESIGDWLKDAGYQVATAETGEQALEMVQKEDFGVVVLDVRLPGRTGLTVLKELKATKPRIKAIVITAYPTTEMSLEAMKLGAVDYLVKPIAPDDLERLIRETLGLVALEPTARVEVEVRPRPPVVEVVKVRKSLVITRESLKSMVERLA